MITQEMIKANAVLAGLTPEQVTAITTLSKNDEEVTIGKRIGELHGSYDNDILSVTSVAKKDGEKSYDYLKRVLSDFKSKAADREDLKAKLAEQVKKTEDLQKLVDGGDSALAKQLKDEKDLTAQLKGKLAEKDTALADAKKDYDAKLLDFRVNSAFDSVFGGLTFRADITDPVKAAMKLAAKNEILARGTFSFNEATNSLELRNDKGEILRNQANNMNPYTLAELVGETSIKDVLQKPKAGGGTMPPKGGGGGGADNLLDLSTAQTQSDADELIAKHLATKGFTVDSAEYWEQYSKIRTDNNVSALPMR